LPTITDPTNKLELEFFGQEYKLKFPRYRYKLKFPRYSVRRAKSRDRTYSAQMYIPAKLTRKDTELLDSINIDENHLTQKKYKKRIVFIGDLPLMTNRGTFIISGILYLVQNVLLLIRLLEVQVSIINKSLIKIISKFIVLV